ncbi:MULTISPECIES: DUF2987 domain-containing protein [Vibrio]|uniref:DUF2987 domain-containing protein n=1 Tax=Vibrio TaxID=662 RepID=UPI0020753E24|nr:MULTISPECIES: DUF2987 domain-containing protein [Vibrio]USD31207.1 DUF2987 domain-containing protein [Vibrio sp. SCSIO 43186]USD44252.1 DUF2987 domain-containing protein [Vibrio sp. SCSIO 43145]USD68330.1 DUF2987 domain-containing protein [Vibrio sp. SCSIO 43139]USD96011.1 hypothetical protein CTT30_07925 [Vibrio coralliilyticus]
MKKLPLAFLAATLSTVVALPVSAQEYMFTYSKLFTHMKQNVKEGHEDVKVGFFFLNADTKQNCIIEKAWMEKEEHYEELKSSPYHELIVPLDNNLKSANPLVFVQTPRDQRCDFSMVVMTREPLKGKVTYEDVEKLMPQMQTMLEDLGGMFASWFTPDVEGVTLEFADKLNSKVEFSDGSSKPIMEGKVQVALSDIGKGGFMILPQETARVLPYLPKAK